GRSPRQWRRGAHQSLDRHSPVCLLRALPGPQDTSLESARLQDCRARPGARGAHGTALGRQHLDAGRVIPMSRRLMTGVAVMIACAGAAEAEIVPLRGIADSRVRTAIYDGNEVYRLRGYVGYQIDLQFEAGELFVGIGAGDIEGISFVSQDNHLFIKP